MTSPYLMVRQALGLNADSGTSMNHYYLYLLLTSLGALDTAAPASPTDPNVFRDVCNRLRAFGGNCFAVQEIERRLLPRGAT